MDAKGLLVASDNHDRSLYTSPQGLTFLHERNIIHRVCPTKRFTLKALIYNQSPQDISPSNVLINHYAADLLSHHSNARKVWRINNDRVKYSLIDFDCAMLLPKSTRRLPSSFAHFGKPVWHPNDICAGEHDYDPYAYDVGCMGNLFADYFDVRMP